MLSGWHISHLPVRLTDQPHVWQVIDRVVVSWTELKVEGFLLMPRPFRISMVPRDAALQLSDTGLVLAGTSEVARISRRRRRQLYRDQRAMMNRAVVDGTGRLWGRLKDVLLDESNLEITRLVVSRGLLGDLLWGALLIRREDVIAVLPKEIKIRALRAPSSMKADAMPD